MTLLDRTLAQIPQSGDAAIESAVNARWDSLTKPRGSLGRLEESLLRLALIQHTATPSADPAGIYIFCGDHGITEEGVSAYPSSVTREMVNNFVRGGAAINVLCRSLNFATHIVDAGILGSPVQGILQRRIASGTRNFAREPAMSAHECMSAVEAGIALASDASRLYNLVGIGEMGIGNSSSASAILAAATGLPVSAVVGRGAGLDDAGLQHKRDVLEKAIALHSVDPASPLAILATFGGFEIAMMTGFLLGSAAHRLAVVVDGFISSAAFLIAHSLAPAIPQRLFFAHRSAEPGHSHILSLSGIDPLLSLDMRLGEGTGAALAMHLLQQAVKLYSEMATFQQASISEKM